MTKAATEKALCGNCGVDVREGTLFCFNCGKRVAEDESAEPQPTDKVKEKAEEKASDEPQKPDADADKEIAKQFRVDEAVADDKLAAAAAKRKKARASVRKSAELVWEPSDGSSTGLLLVVTLVITAIAAAVVVLALYLK